MQAPETEIVVSKDGVELLRCVVQPGEYVLGRASDCDLPFEADLVSRRHAQLTIESDQIFVQDLGSSNGTHINGKPVTEITRLWPNQQIQVGNAMVEVHRLKTDSSSDASLPPVQAAVQRMLPEELLHGKKYDIGGVIAQGGMGAILNAREAATDRMVAMKVMLNSSSVDDLGRFIAEAKVTAKLEHPNIVPVHELSVDEHGQPFYTMKMVRGVTLRKVLELLAAGTDATVKKYPLGSLLTIFQKLCDAVAFAHSKGVIHRDLKPENVMLGDFGEVLVMDWGLAKLVGKAEAKLDDPSISSIRDLPPEASGATLAGTVMGTPQYMSPEQARGEVEDTDARSDIYALGTVLYHILALRPPVTGRSAAEVVSKVAEGHVEPLNLANEKTTRPLHGAHIPDSLAAVVRKAMAFQREQRYRSVEELQADLTAYQNGFATSAENAGAWRHFKLFVARHRGISIAVAAGFMIVSALTTAFTVRVVLERNRTAQERDRTGKALDDLKSTAPTFQAMARALVDQGNFDEALEKIGYAIQLDDGNADYRLFRANLLEASQRLDEAVAEYRLVLRLRPTDEIAAANLQLCERLIAKNGNAWPLPHDLQHELLQALRQQGRLVEAAPLNSLFDSDRAVAEATLLARLGEYRQQAGWKENRLIDDPNWSEKDAETLSRKESDLDAHRVFRLADDTFRVDLNHLGIGDLARLQGLPISMLDLHGQLFDKNGLSDLSKLSDLPLTDLDISDTQVKNLSALHKMPLQKLNVSGTKVDDLGPLAGMKLRKLIVGGRGGSLATSIGDLRPLSGAPLEYLDLSGLKMVIDLSPVKGAPLRYLNLSGTSVNDLTPLRGAPLRTLLLQRTPVTDIAPLANCQELEELNLYSTKVEDLTPIAGHKLTRFDGSWTKIKNLEPLRGQPLKYVKLDGYSVTDIGPLAACPALEVIYLPRQVANVEVLRSLPHLRVIVPLDGPPRTAEEFWKDFDAKKDTRP